VRVAVLGAEQRADLISGLLEGTPIAQDECEMERFLRLETKDMLKVALLTKHGEANTVEKALEDYAERKAVHLHAIERRKSFRVVLSADAEEGKRCEVSGSRGLVRSLLKVLTEEGDEKRAQGRG
jgi:hypothetical protein